MQQHHVLKMAVCFALKNYTSIYFDYKINISILFYPLFRLHKIQYPKFYNPKKMNACYVS